MNPRDLEREIDLDCTRALYRQIPNSFAAAMVVTAYMAATLWRLVPHSSLWAWLGVQAVAQVHRGAVLVAFRRAEAAGRVDVGSAAVWGRRYAAYMGVAGAVWALAALLFAEPSQPLALAFTLCGLYGITGGAVPGNAYHRAAVMNFIWPIFGAVMLRMAWTGRLEFTSLGLASMAYAVILTLFCRVQHTGIRDALRVRFDNRILLAQLEVEKAEAVDARSRAEQASLAKSRFLAAASHDLRQPLHALGLFAASLHELRLDDQALGAVRNIQANIDALEDLFDALLDVSRLDAGVIEAQRVPLSLQPVLEGVMAGLHSVAQAKGLTLRVLPCTAWVWADPVLLRQVLNNLMANALRYTERGQVVLAVRRGGNGRVPASWRIECRDSGIGIAPADQQRIFEEFVQLHNLQRDRRQGLGLGLAIAQRCARLQGSDIKVRSRPGAGSVFALALPAAEPLPPRRAGLPAEGQGLHVEPRVGSRWGPAEASDDDPLSGCRVLVIDDESSIREGLALLLSQWGCDVVAVADSNEALAAFDDRIELVLADLRLPGEHNGLDTLAHLRDLRAVRGMHLPACLITGESDPAALRQARDSRVPLLHKPVRAGQLRAALLHVLSATRPGDT